MAGHSHWAGIKHKKALQDAKRGKVFTKHTKRILLATKDGGKDSETNFKLRLAIEKAKSDNVPKEKIENAIKRGAGELKGEEIEEVIYEALGPEKISILILAATDNRNRTVSELRNILSKNNWKMGEPGSVMWNFTKTGKLALENSSNQSETLELLAIEAGANEIERQKKKLIVYTNHQDIKKAREFLEKRRVKVLDAEIVFLPKTKVEISLEAKENYTKLLEILSNQDDVQEIYDNIK